MIFQDALGSLNPVKTIGLPADRGDQAPHRRGQGRRPRARGGAARRGRVQTPRARLDQYPHEFSGGMRQRVMIAMALASNPELLIADEPTTALDVTTQAGVIDLLHRLSEERRMAVMLITHDLGVIASFAEDVLVMYAGAPVELGAVEDVFARAGHPYTQALIAAVPQLGDARAEALPSIPGRTCRAQTPFHPAVASRLGAGSRAAVRSAAASGPPSTQPTPQLASPAISRTSRARRRGSSTGRRSSSASRRSAARCSRSRTSPRTTARAAPALASGWLRAVESVSFAIRSGESLGLVGESGSGKSTVARLLLGAHRSGPAVRWYSRGARSRPRVAGSRRSTGGRVQMVFQDPGDSLNPLLTIEQIVAEPLLLLHLRRQAKQQRGRVPALLELGRARGRDYGKRRPLQLSGGQRQRVAIARALATDRALVVSMRPCRRSTSRCCAQIHNSHGPAAACRPLPYLFISHDLDGPPTSATASP